MEFKFNIRLVIDVMKLQGRTRISRTFVVRCLNKQLDMPVHQLINAFSSPSLEEWWGNGWWVDWSWNQLWNRCRREIGWKWHRPKFSCKGSQEQEEHGGRGVVEKGGWEERGRGVGMGGDYTHAHALAQERAVGEKSMKSESWERGIAPNIKMTNLWRCSSIIFYHRKEDGIHFDEWSEIKSTPGLTSTASWIQYWFAIVLLSFTFCMNN